MLNLDMAIDCAIQLYGKEEYTEAYNLAMDSLKLSIDSYELYYILALCQESLGNVEESYFLFNMAIILSGSANDKELLIEGYNNLCSYAQVDDYTMGKACEEIAIQRVKLGEYNNTHRFLSEQLYTTNKVLGKMVLTENNMLLFMMLEITLCEINNKSHVKVKGRRSDNTCITYNNDIAQFNNAYKKVKLAIRRIWFGFSVNLQKNIDTLLDEDGISPDMLVVTAKYSVPPEYWQDTFLRLQAIVQYRHPDAAYRIGQYIQWMKQQNIGIGNMCEKPQEANLSDIESLNEQVIEVIKLDMKVSGKVKYNADMQAGERLSDSADDNKISIIFCTNDELYADECVNYVEQLTVPEDIKLNVIEVWNAPGMAAGYNYAMNYSNSRYKIYIHHDTFILNKNILQRVLDTFSQDKEIGMIGIMGSVKLCDDGFWWNGDKKYFRMYMYQDAILDIKISKYIADNIAIEDAEALDGIFLATNTDIVWQEKVFDNWHFYDISQCYEFRKNGLRTVCLNSLSDKDSMFVCHETTMKKDPDKRYDEYRRIFKDIYM